MQQEFALMAALLAAALLMAAALMWRATDAPGDVGLMAGAAATFSAVAGAFVWF